MSDVFISYKAEEFDEAMWVKTTLETNGISCWMAPMSIPGGSSYAVEIPRAIKACTVFVLILSEQSQASKWVPKEVDQAINAGKIILPFMLENCSLKDDFNFYLTNIQRYRAYESKSVAMEKMLREIKSIIGTSIAAKGATASVGAQPIEVEHTSARLAEKNGQFVEAEEKPLPDLNAKSGRRKKSAEGKQQSKAKKKVNIGAIAAAVLAAVVAVALLAVAVSAMSTVKIAGKKYKINDSNYLTIENCDITSEDLEGMKKLKSIKRLVLTNCSLPDIDELNPVLEKVELEVQLDNCNVTDKMLSKMNFNNWNARKLGFNNNAGITAINRLAPLKGSLLSLHIDNCGISDISILSEFTVLEAVHASGNKLTDVSALSSCKKLTSVKLSDNELTKLFEVPSDSKLMHVSADNNKLTNLDGMEKALKLTTLSVSGNNLMNINGLQNATLLDDVDLSGNMIEDISLLAKSSETLTKLNLSGNSISSVTALADCKKLRKLYVDNNKLVNLYGMGEYTELEEFSAADNKLTGIAELEKCTKLRLVNVADNEISSIKALESMSKTETLEIDVSNNKITELTLPLGKSFRRLAFYGNPVAGPAKEYMYSGSEIAFDYSEKIDFEAFALAFDFYTYYIFDCPLDKQEAVKKTFGYHTVKFMTEKEYLESKAS